MRRALRRGPCCSPAAVAPPSNPPTQHDCVASVHKALVRPCCKPRACPGDWRPSCRSHQGEQLAGLFAQESSWVLLHCAHREAGSPAGSRAPVGEPCGWRRPPAGQRWARGVPPPLRPRPRRAPIAGARPSRDVVLLPPGGWPCTVLAGRVRAQVLQAASSWSFLAEDIVTEATAQPDLAQAWQSAHTLAHAQRRVLLASGCLCLQRRCRRSWAPHCPGLPCRQSLRAGLPLHLPLHLPPGRAWPAPPRRRPVPRPPACPALPSKCLA